MMPEPTSIRARSSWHALAAKDAATVLETDLRAGLSSGAVSARQAQCGPNTLTARRGTPAWKRFLLQFNHPLVYILLAAVLVTGLLREWVDFAVIFGVVLVNAIIGFIKESKAEKAIAIVGRTARRSPETRLQPPHRISRRGHAC